MGKSTISMAMFNSYVKLPEGRISPFSNSKKIEFILIVVSYIHYIPIVSHPYCWPVISQLLASLWPLAKQEEDEQPTADAPGICWRIFCSHGGFPFTKYIRYLYYKMWDLGMVHDIFISFMRLYLLVWGLFIGIYSIHMRTFFGDQDAHDICVSVIGVPPLSSRWLIILAIGFSSLMPNLPGLVNIEKKRWKDPPFSMGTSTISMVIFNSYVTLPEGIFLGITLDYNSTIYMMCNERAINIQYSKDSSHFILVFSVLII